MASKTFIKLFSAMRHKPRIAGHIIFRQDFRPQHELANEMRDHFQMGRSPGSRLPYERTRNWEEIDEVGSVIAAN